MNALNASSSSSDEPSARAHRFAASRTSTRRPSTSRSASASSSRACATSVSVRSAVHEPADDRARSTGGPPNGNVIRSAMNAGGPNRSARHHSANVRIGSSASETSALAEQPVAQGGLDDDEHESPARRASVLEREQNSKAADHGEVEEERHKADRDERSVRGRVGGDEEEPRPDREDGGDDPGGGLVSRWIALAENADLEHGRTRRLRDAPMRASVRVCATLAHRSSIRVRAHAACSRSISSSDSRYTSAAARCSAPPTFPSATSALRRSQRASLRGT